MSAPQEGGHTGSPLHSLLQIMSASPGWQEFCRLGDWFDQELGSYAYCFFLFPARIIQYRETPGLRQTGEG